MATKLEELNHFAEEMVKVFKDHSEAITVRSDVSSDEGVTQHFVSNVGLSKLGHIFDHVLDGDKAAVYSFFVERLEKEGIIYSVEQFGGTVH